MHAGDLTAKVEADTEARSVGKHDGQETDNRHDATTVNRAEVSQEQDRVDCDEQDSSSYQAKVILDVLDDSLREALDRKEVESGSSSSRLPIIELFQDLLLEAKRHEFVNT